VLPSTDLEAVLGVQSLSDERAAPALGPGSQPSLEAVWIAELTRPLRHKSRWHEDEYVSLANSQPNALAPAILRPLASPADVALREQQCDRRERLPSLSEANAVREQTAHLLGPVLSGAVVKERPATVGESSTRPRGHRRLMRLSRVEG
jgi:hypothetical protein